MSDTKKKLPVRPVAELKPEEARAQAKLQFQVNQANLFLAKFKRPPIPLQELAAPEPDPRIGASTEQARDAYWGGDWETIRTVYKSPETPVEAKDAIRAMMLDEDAGRQALANDPDLAAVFLSTADPDTLADTDLWAALGNKKTDVIAASLMTIAKKQPAPNDQPLDRETQRDPALFSVLAEQLTLEAWNDTSNAIGARKRGLGPRVCMELWRSHGYDEICALIRSGVDTSVAARAEGSGTGGGVRTGFVQPVQHVAAKCLRDIASIDTERSADWTPFANRQVRGAAKINAALEASDTAVTLTKWKDVQDSDMIKEFQKNPGTIWGFEEVRQSYVDAAHETPQGVQPLRMMELWKAVEQALSADGYDALLANPKAAADKYINAALGNDLAKPYADKDKATYIANFKRDAKAFLLEFAAQVPKATVIRPARDATGGARPGVSVADIAGVSSQLMPGIACKAGLWWAKNEKKPVYYILDGVDMDDVVNYKTLKNQAISNFIDAGGQPAGAQGHHETITLVEIREILKHWDELGFTPDEGGVRFVEKGKMLDGQDLADKLADWQTRMRVADTAAGRAPAPDRQEFKHDLDAIDPAVFAKLADGEEGDKDARDIVRKANYLINFANTRPQYALKYLMSKCDVLRSYGLIPVGLPTTAVAFSGIVSRDPPAPKSDVEAAERELVAEIKRCRPMFQKPLAKAILDQPLIGRDRVKAALRQ